MNSTLVEIIGNIVNQKRACTSARGGDDFTSKY